MMGVVTAQSHSGAEFFKLNQMIKTRPPSPHENQKPSCRITTTVYEDGVNSRQLSLVLTVQSNATIQHVN